MKERSYEIVQRRVGLSLHLTAMAAIGVPASIVV
jgi:hypothetical protein